MRPTTPNATTLFEDDALIGVRSSARRMGTRVRQGVAAFYGLALALWAGALWLTRPDPLVLVALAPAAVHLGWQVATLDPADGANALARFRSNRMTGLFVALACLVVGL
jgi:4-hydroxybenzoate polyprenyltransferase